MHHYLEPALLNLSIKHEVLCRQAPGPVHAYWDLTGSQGHFGSSHGDLTQMVFFS